MISKRTYHVWVVIITALFLISGLQRNIDFWQFKPLKGAHTSLSKPKITLTTWLNGSYQKKADTYCTDAFGFQEPLVRLVNELDYRWFNAANAKYVIVGANDYLYETPYIEAHLGMDYLGDSLIKDYVTKMVRLRDTLKQLNVDLYMLFAPGKGSFYAEHIPEYYWQYQIDSTNYDRFTHHMDQQGFEYLDFHRWFRQMKDTASYPLLPNTGIHWSKYGMVLATDSISKYWQQKFPYQPGFEYSDGELSSIAQGSDADVEDGMNLLSDIPNLTMMYPKHDFAKTPKPGLKTAVIADSYYWGLFNIGLSTMASDSGEFWYYFKQVYPQHFTNQLMIEDLDLQQAIESKDVIMLLQTDATLDRFGFGFVEAAYALYFSDTSRTSTQLLP